MRPSHLPTTWCQFQESVELTSSLCCPYGVIDPFQGGIPSLAFLVLDDCYSEVCGLAGVGGRFAELEEDCIREGGSHKMMPSFCRWFSPFRESGESELLFIDFKFKTLEMWVPGEV